MEIIQIKYEHVHEVAEALTQAFTYDPLFSYVFPDKERRIHHLKWIFSRWVRVFIRLQCGYTTHECTGAALWHPPQGNMFSWVWDSIKAGLPLAPFRLSCGEMRRGLKTYVDATLHMRRNMKEPHWVLDSLGVLPVRQGCGYSRRLLLPVLNRADAEGKPCYLITNSLKNISIYERFGFVIADQYIMPGTDLMMCGMRRLPLMKQGLRDIGKK